MALLKLENEIAQDIKRYIDNEKEIAALSARLREFGAAFAKLGKELGNGKIAENMLSECRAKIEEINAAGVTANLDALSEAYARRDSLGTELKGSGYLPILEKLDAS